MCERGEPFKRELRNNNQEDGVLADGDANANEIREQDGRRTGDTGTLSDQDKVVVWGTDSQCDDPELAEFEMLECQELESYLIEEGEDFVGLADRKDIQVQSSPCSKPTAEMSKLNKSREDRRSNPQGASEHDSSLALVSESTEVSRTELNSEADVFLSCLSTISTVDNAVDNASITQTTDSMHIAEASQKTDHPSLIKSTKQQRDVDMNLNSAVQSEVVGSQPNVNTAVGIDECRMNNNKRNKAEGSVLERCDGAGRKNEHKGLATEKSPQETNKMDKSTQADEDPAANYSPYRTSTKGTQSSLESKAIKKQGSFDNTLKKQNSFDKTLKKQPSFENTFRKQHSFDNSLKKQGSFENSVTAGSSTLEGRKPWGSPSRQAAPSSPRTSSFSPNRRPPGSPAKVQGMRAMSLERSHSPQRGQTIKPPGRTGLSSGIPKPVMTQQKEPEPRRSSPPQKPKNVRPKIITYIRKNPQAKTHEALEASPHPLRLSSYSSPPAPKDLKGAYQPKSAPAPCTSNVLFDGYKQEMQRGGQHQPPGMVVTGMKPPSSTIPQKLGVKSNSFHKDTAEKHLQEHVSAEGGGVFRSPRALRPQLGLGAVTRQPAAKTRVQQMGQRSAPNQSGQAAGVPTHGYQDHTGEHIRSGDKAPETAPRSLLLKPGQSGLRPPGFSSLPARLTTFGFARSSSASSVSSNQSNDSGHSDHCQLARDPGGGSDDILLIKASASPSEASQESRSQPPNAPSLQRRSLPPQRSSPLASRRDVQKDKESLTPLKSSSKRFAVISPKPQSPVRGRSADQAERAQELDRALIQQLRERCEQQSLQLQILQAQFKKASMCLDVFTITTQHFCQKSESAIVKERELSLELARIRDEVAFSVAHWEQLQQEKQEQECRFEAELQGLRARQQGELRTLEERLRAQHMAEAESLQAQQQGELEELRFKQQEQIEEMREDHETSLMEMEMTHGDTLATLQEEHARTVKNLKMAHEQQTKSLEEEFEKIRLSLQDQVDTLTFQNRSLRDRAKRFEEALRRSTDEQIVEALAPYKHIEEDLKSLKEVLEMKNQQIHQQDLKISELEKIAEKNVYLEERLQVLQQQNEDLKERIDKNVAVSRQLSEENANLQVHVEKESNEKKRLSRTNEELLWRLQTGDLSPRMSPSSSPLHRPSSGPGSPARPHSYHQ